MISGALIDPYGSHDEFDSVNNALKEHDDMKEKSKSMTSEVYQKC